ncbi:MAG: hypothetical protein A2945_04845 [Candidatus Liptonbacteria bacterium RIFCSPLOWO2_01_FULL_52_25]|uniref:Uncharacterized protein n=1 Tax=Candidatus Liptonbacteria bacterium RIFCSPLOWO2_01_FULL_52_25 TaxID=1798650 RepID=A0A1G2CDJ8_9BACT|nr:MAG: hypothetical protein A2945_04845 [Candidatus Liptonbacteria bacterium RIFCSPLOWO2_01_FULL_52_25]
MDTFAPVGSVLPRSTFSRLAATGVDLESQALNQDLSRVLIGRVLVRDPNSVAALIRKNLTRFAATAASRARFLFAPMARSRCFAVRALIAQEGLPRHLQIPYDRSESEEVLSSAERMYREIELPPLNIPTNLRMLVCRFRLIHLTGTIRANWRMFLPLKTEELMI